MLHDKVATTSAMANNDSLMDGGVVDPQDIRINWYTTEHPFRLTQR